jgi:hypothetical protein
VGRHENVIDRLPLVLLVNCSDPAYLSAFLIMDAIGPANLLFEFCADIGVFMPYPGVWVAYRDIP